MKSFETSGMFVQEMILVAFFLLILVEIRLLCIQHSRKRKVEVMAVNFLLLSVTYGILTDLLSDYLAIWEGKNKLLHIAARWPDMLPSYRTMKYKSPIWGYFHVQKE